MKLLLPDITEFFLQIVPICKTTSKPGIYLFKCLFAIISIMARIGINPMLKLVYYCNPWKCFKYIRQLLFFARIRSSSLSK